MCVVGGSVLSPFGLKENEKNLVEHLCQLNKSVALTKEISIGGLTFSKALPIIEGLNKSDLLILYFGTSVAWPVPSRRVAAIFDKNKMNPKFFHKSPFKSKGITKRLFNKLRFNFFVLVKIVLLPFGLYGPKHSFEDLPDLVEAIVQLSKSKARTIIWIQHRTYGYHQFRYEKKIYNRYYNEVLTNLEKHRSANFRVLRIPNLFLKSDNYLLDCIHLSEKGHYNLSKLINSEIKKTSI
jgi:hypothetical protein